MRKVAVAVALLLVPLAVGCQRAAPPSNKAELNPAVKQDQPSPSPDRPKGEPWVSQTVDLGQIIDWGDAQGPLIGWRHKDGQRTEYSITANALAVDRWEDGKRGTFAWERWDVTCSDPDTTGGRGTYCNLHILRVINFGAIGPTVTTEDYSTADGTLRVSRADWNAGALDLTTKYPNETSAEIELRFEYRDDVMYLRSLRGLATVRELLGDRRLVPVEYRLADYDYTLNIPLTLHGHKTTGMKLWNELVASLSAADQEAWQKLRAGDHRLNDISPQDRDRALREVIPGEAGRQGKRTLTDREEQKLDRVSRQLVQKHLSEFFANSQLSPAAQARMVALAMSRGPQ